MLVILYKFRFYISEYVLESASVVDIVDGVADGCFVSEDELFGECFVLEYEYELVSLYVVFAAEKQKVVCAFRGVGAVRAVWCRRSFDSEEVTV